MWPTNQPGAQFIAHWEYGEKRQPRFLQFRMKPQTKLIMIITTFINSLSQHLDFLTLPLYLRQIFPSVCFFFTLSQLPPLSCFTRKRGNKIIITNSQANSCSHVFWTIMCTVLCRDPWKWPAVKSEVEEERVICQQGVLHAHVHVNISVSILIFLQKSRTILRGRKESEAEGERAGTLLWYLSDYNESLSSHRAHCCDLIWFLSYAEMLHYQVGSKLCLNQ